MRLAILVREETMQRCTGKGCLNAFFQRKDAFERYEDNIELIAFSHAGGDIDRKIEMMIKNGVNVVHLSSTQTMLSSFWCQGALIWKFLNMVKLK